MQARISEQGETFGGGGQRRTWSIEMQSAHTWRRQTALLVRPLVLTDVFNVVKVQERVFCRRQMNTKCFTYTYRQGATTYMNHISDGVPLLLDSFYI